MSLSDRLVEIREKNGYTRKRLADELGKPYATITKYETGEREPGHSYIIEIAEKFRVTTDYILGVSDRPNKNAPSLSDEAMQIARKYDSLDDHGQCLTKMVIDEELNRANKEGNKPFILAAARSGERFVLDAISEDDLPLESSKIP